LYKNINACLSITRYSKGNFNPKSKNGGALSEWQIQSLGVAFKVWQQIWPNTRLNPVFAETKFSDCH
jgi:hypothetical protein